MLGRYKKMSYEDMRKYIQNTILSENPKCQTCSRETRRKLQSDWKRGEKLGKPYYPEMFDYFYCDNCKRGWTKFKGENNNKK